MFFKEFNQIQQHVQRVKNQYWECMRLKTALPSIHIFIQMDFAEDYKCFTQDEVQSTYWNSTHVTNHPTVIYFKQNNYLGHKSVAYISGEKSHSAPTIYAILQKLEPTIKELVPSPKVIYYWTDSSKSQYRNKKIFYIIAQHEDLFGISSV